uniref:Uncharacterized protein n=1 Tax=Sinocyclocheilus grahami TaxID=75366 RepID=A0A672N3K6_SINGR
TTHKKLKSSTPTEVKSKMFFAFLSLFCCTGTAFLLVTPEEFPAKPENSELFERIEKFVQVHRNRFLLLQALFYGKREWEILSSVQNRFLGCNLRVIPVHSTADVVKGMLVIAKVTSKPNVANLRDPMSLACTYIIDHSPDWGNASRDAVLM